MMPAEIRAATLNDLPLMVDLLTQDARCRQAHDPALWTLHDDASKKIAEAVEFALTAEKQPFRQKWLVADTGGELTGVVHSVLLPVPPIYAGMWGDPGLLMPECFATAGAPSGTLQALVEAAEADLREAGAELLLASFVCGDALRECFEQRGYRPLTLYLAKSDLEGAAMPPNVHPASDSDIAGIVRRSAENRKILGELDVFWTPHVAADERFADWMRRCLTMDDRDMLVCGTAEALEGYVIAQPVSRLHFPPAHDVRATGVIDDYYHTEYSEPAELHDHGNNASSLLHAAEASFASRGISTAVVVCPAAWTSKIKVLERNGYETAIEWMIRR